MNRIIGKQIKNGETSMANKNVIFVSNFAYYINEVEEG